MHQKTQILAPFEGLRGLAALAVFLYHFHHVRAHSGTVATVSEFLNNGWIFVDVFFVLSGWVIGHVYFDRFQNDLRGTLRPFFVARFARLAPLCLFVVLTWVVVAPWLGKSTNLAAIIDCLPQLVTLTFNWGPLYCASPVPPAWSISAEAMAYLVFPVVVAFGCLQRPQFAVLLVMAGVVTYLAIHTAWGSIHVIDGRAPLRAVAGFSIGCGLWRLSMATNAEALPQAQWVVVLGLFAGLLLDWPPLVILVLATALIWTVRSGGGGIARFLSCKPLMHLGRLSFGLYLWHWLAIAALQNRTVPMTLLDAIAAIAVVLIVAEVSFRLIEAPARKSLRGWFGTPMDDAYSGRRSFQQ